jgi:hypothetical protein
MTSSRFGHGDSKMNIEGSKWYHDLFQKKFIYEELCHIINAKIKVIEALMTSGIRRC